LNRLSIAVLSRGVNGRESHSSALQVISSAHACHFLATIHNNPDSAP
jgi:hypothetical protein